MTNLDSVAVALGPPAGVVDRNALRRIFGILCTFAAYLVVVELLGVLLRWSSLTNALLEFLPYCLVLVGVIYCARPLVKLDKQALLMGLCLGCTFIVLALDLTRSVHWFNKVPLLGRDSHIRGNISTLSNVIAIAAFPAASYFMILEVLEAKTLMGVQVAKLQDVEKALTLQKMILEAQNEASLDGLLTVDENQKVMSHNRRFAEMWAVPPAVMETGSGEALLQLLLQRVMDPQAMEARVRDLYQNKDLQTLEDVYLRDGRTFKRFSAPVFSATGEYFGRIWVYRDVTEQIRSEKELRRLYEQTLQDAETKTELLREINHRVKNNLVSILGLIQTQHRHTPNQLERSVVKTALERLSQQVRGLIEVHQMLSGTQWRPMLLADLAFRIINAVTSMIEPSTKIKVEITNSPILVSPRLANSIGLALNELATNTLKHATIGRSIARVKVRMESKGDWIHLEYRDDGPGFPANVLDGSQHGVGLALLQQLSVGAFRGSLEVSNETGAKVLLTIKNDEIDRT